MLEKIIINYRKKRKILSAKRVFFLGKILGLMFRKGNHDILLFDFFSAGRRSIHSFFVFFSFIAVWLDERNNVLDYRIVRPFTLSVCSKYEFCKLIEIPINYRNKELIKFLVGKGKI